MVKTDKTAVPDNHKATQTNLKQPKQFEKIKEEVDAKLQTLRDQIGQTTCVMLIEAMQQSESNGKPVQYSNKTLMQFISEYEALAVKEKIQRQEIT